MTDAYQAADWIERLDLQPHPEGGYFREIYRATEDIPVAGLPGRFSGPRSTCTAIYYLLERGAFSTFHRIRSDELWHWYAGGALELFILEEDGSLRALRLGSGDGFMQVAPAGRWCAARCPVDAPYVLVGCTVAPGFDFADFELADRETLLARFPAQAAIIKQLTC
jgi:predicted cupin superfamily sugar epimerase